MMSLEKLRLEIVEDIATWFTDELERHDATIASLIVELAELREAVSKRPPPRHKPGWVPLKEAAFQTGHSPETIRRWAASGKIDATMRGGCWSVRLGSVQKIATTEGGLAFVK
jgi:hypothetical protein